MTNKLVPPVIDVQVQLAQVFMRAGDYAKAPKELDQAKTALPKALSMQPDFQVAIEPQA
ncbi:MAG: hypothetical protein V3V52_05400 [Candidatus Adiutricales bacterium]